jgi:hypothetical protein
MAKQLNDRLQKEGVKTHKERVEELNKYLSKLSEHHDMYALYLYGTRTINDCRIYTDFVCSLGLKSDRGKMIRIRKIELVTGGEMPSQEWVSIFALRWQFGPWSGNVL